MWLGTIISLQVLGGRKRSQAREANHVYQEMLQLASYSVLFASIGHLVVIAQLSSAQCKAGYVNQHEHSVKTWLPTAKIHRV